jgi:hypothetical protein
MALETTSALWNGFEPHVQTSRPLVKVFHWRESPQNAVLRSRWARSIGVVKTNEIGLVDGDDAALAKISGSLFPKIVSS